MCLLFDFSVIRSELWLNPVCKVLSLLRELGATCTRRQAGENPQQVPVSPEQAALCPFCSAMLAPPARVEGLRMDPGAPGHAVPAGPLARWGTDPQQEQSPFLPEAFPQCRPWDGVKHAGA